MCFDSTQKVKKKNHNKCLMFQVNKLKKKVQVYHILLVLPAHAQKHIHIGCSLKLCPHGQDMSSGIHYTVAPFSDTEYPNKVLTRKMIMMCWS